MTPEQAREWLIGYDRAHEQLDRELRSVNGRITPNDLDPRYAIVERRDQ